jgi:hypothetical protein
MCSFPISGDTTIEGSAYSGTSLKHNPFGGNPLVTGQKAATYTIVGNSAGKNTDMKAVNTLLGIEVILSAQIGPETVAGSEDIGVNTERGIDLLFGRERQSAEKQRHRTDFQFGLCVQVVHGGQQKKRQNQYFFHHIVIFSALMTLQTVKKLSEQLQVFHDC